MSATPGVSRRPALGMAGAVTAVLVWGVSSVLIKNVDGLNGLGVACYRVWLGALVVTAVFVAGGGRVSVRLLRVSLFGGVAFAADLVLFFVAVQETSVANATVIGALQPLLVLAVANRLFGERPRRAEIGWGAVALAGTLLVVAGGASNGVNSLHGDLVAVGAVVAWTAYFVCSKSARKELSALEYLTGMSIVAAVAIVPLPLLFHGAVGGTTTQGWVTLAFITLINGLIGHFLMAYAHGHVSLLTLSLLTLAIPVAAAASAAVFIDEPLSLEQVAGMAVVLGALALMSLRMAQRSPDLVAADVQALESLPHP